MPKNSTRHWCKRKLCSAKGNIDQCGIHLYAVSEAYKEHHPEISDQLDMIMVILQEADNILDGIEKGI